MLSISYLVMQLPEMPCPEAKKSALFLEAKFVCRVQNEWASLFVL